MFIDNLKVEADNAALPPLPLPCSSSPLNLPAISPIPRRERSIVRALAGRVEGENGCDEAVTERGDPVSVEIGKATEEYPNLMSFEPGVYKLPGRTVPFYITPAIDHCGMCGKRPKSKWCKHLIAAGAKEGIVYQGKIHTASLSARGSTGLRLSEFVQISEFFQFYITDICQISESFAKSVNLE